MDKNIFTNFSLFKVKNINLVNLKLKILGFLCLYKFSG